MSTTQHTGHYLLPENPPADMAFITQSEADARYVERNPTVANFETKGA